MVNASNSAQRKAISSDDCVKDFLSSSSSTEVLEQNVDVLLLVLDQDVNDSKTLGESDHYIPNRGPTCIIFSRLVFTKSRRRM